MKCRVLLTGRHFRHSKGYCTSKDEAVEWYEVLEVVLEKQSRGVMEVVGRRRLRLYRPGVRVRARRAGLG